MRPADTGLVYLCNLQCSDGLSHHLHTKHPGAVNVPQTGNAPTLKTQTKATAKLVASQCSDPPYTLLSWGTIVHAYRSCMQPRKEPKCNSLQNVYVITSGCKCTVLKEIVFHKGNPAFVFIGSQLGHW